MIYVALLRGINVGGKNKVEMAKLKASLERLGCQNVRTYINSGNVIFRDNRSAKTLVPLIEKAIEKDFGFRVPIILRDLPNLQRIIKTMPSTWVNDITMKCDVLFLWDTHDRPDAIQHFKFNPQFEDVVYVPGAIITRIDHDYITRSAYMKIAGTELYKNLTARNCNTVRKLAALMQSLDT